MSYDIFAAGSHKFHFQRKGLADSGTIEAVKIIAILSSFEASAYGAAAAAGDHFGKGIADVAESYANIETLHNLGNAVSFLAMCSGSANGYISVDMTLENTFWANDAAFARYDFSPGDSPSVEFFRKILPGLKKTDMDNWGTLMGLALTLNAYYNAIPDDATPMINISLTK